LIRPWRRATIAASTIAAAELIILLVVGAILLAKPVAHALEKKAAATIAKTTTAAVTAQKRKLDKAIKAMTAPARHAVPRSRMHVMVFNGNGRAGAAGTQATQLQGLGYKIAGATNAARQDYATTVVMYTRGHRAEGLRLAKDIGTKVVGPL